MFTCIKSLTAPTRQSRGVRRPGAIISARQQFQSGKWASRPKIQTLIHLILTVSIQATTRLTVRVVS
jgi:hypothetical protein